MTKLLVPSKPNNCRTQAGANMLAPCRAAEGSTDPRRLPPGSQPEAAVNAACRAALLHAQHYNAWLEQSAALVDLAAAWQGAVEVIIVQRSNSASPRRASMLGVSDSSGLPFVPDPKI